MQGRRRTVYFIDRRHVSGDQLNVVRRFSSGNYAFSVVGLLKVFTAVLFLVEAIVFLASSDCAEAPAWYSGLQPGAGLAAGVLLLVMYILFTLGFAEERLSAWIKADLSLLLAAAALSIVASALTLSACDTKGTMHIVPGVLGLVCALLLLVDAAALFVMWRSGDDDGAAMAAAAAAASGPTAGGLPGDRPPPRKSIFI